MPEFTTNGSHINVKNSAFRPKEYEVEGGFKFDKNTKVVEINGKKYLVRPEIEDDQQDYDCKLFSTQNLQIIQTKFNFFR